MTDGKREGATTEAQAKKLVACVGNMLLLDEGFGPYMARVLTEPQIAAEYFDQEHVQQLMGMFRLDQTDAPDDGRIPVLDAGTIGMGLLPWIRTYDRIVVVDIIDTKSPSIPAGSVMVLTPEEMAESAVMHSLHDLKLIDVINSCALAGYTADISCVCVQAQNYDPEDFVIGLTEPVKAAIPIVMDALMEELALK